jgi:hypothetical protein
MWLNNGTFPDTKDKKLGHREGRSHVYYYYNALPTHFIEYSLYVWHCGKLLNKQGVSSFPKVAQLVKSHLFPTPYNTLSLPLKSLLSLTQRYLPWEKRMDKLPQLKVLIKNKLSALCAMCYLHFTKETALFKRMNLKWWVLGSRDSLVFLHKAEVGGESTWWNGGKQKE